MFKNIYNIWYSTTDLNSIKIKLNVWYFTNIKYFFLKNNIYIQYYINFLSNVKYKKIQILKYTFDFSEFYFIFLKFFVIIILLFLFV